MKGSFEQGNLNNSDDFIEEIDYSSISPSSDEVISETSGNENSGSSFTNKEETISDNLSESNKQNKISNISDENKVNNLNGYDRAQSSRDAYKRKLDNKEYYNEKLKDVNNKKQDLEKNLDKSKEKKEKAQERLNDLKQRRNSIPRNQRTKEEKQEYKDAKSEVKKTKDEEKSNKNKLSSLKNDSKRIKKDDRKSKQFAATHPLEAARMKVEQKVKKIAKKVFKKVLIILAPYIGGFLLILLLAFFVIELILGPLMEVWGYIDEGITNTANFSEKVTNFYNGFGFQDSKEAFYDELDDLCERYGCSNDGTGMDVPLLLATIFYTEGMGYDTSYGEIEAEGSIDESLNGIGDNKGIFNSIREYLREKFDEAQQTVDENGLVYNVGKIYRLRKLARNQFHTDFFGNPTRQGESKSMSLSKFLDKYGSTISSDVLELLKDFVGIVWNVISAPFKELGALITGSEYLGSFVDNAGEATEDFKSTFKQLIGDIFYGIADITDVKFNAAKATFTIEFKTFVYDEENYEKYLTDYYFEDMPEFKKMLNGYNGEARETRKEQLYKDIVANKDLFVDIFLKYQMSNSEGYMNNCVGAIDNNLVSGLNLPTDISEGVNIAFEGNYSYGIVDGQFHNGVDLNETTSGVKLGSNVYSIANGKVVSISNVNDCSDSNGETCNKSIKISHNVIIENKEYKFTSIYTNVIPKDKLSIDDSVSKGETIGTISTSNNDEGLHFSFLDNSSSTDGTSIDPTNLFISCSTGTLTGDSNEEKIWNYLLGLGYSKAGAAGVLGNWKQESGYLPNNLENGANTKSGLSDEEFTNQVNNNTISKEEFIKSEKFSLYSGGRYGYGLAQWTDPGRKTNFYEFWKSQNVPSIDDLKMQLDFYKKEADGYSTLHDDLSKATSPEEAASLFVKIYEVGTAEESRKKNAREIYNTYANR